MLWCLMRMRINNSTNSGIEYIHGWIHVRFIYTGTRVQRIEVCVII